MTKIRSYRDLLVWQKAMDLAVRIHSLTTRFLGTAAALGLAVLSGALTPAKAQTVQVDSTIPGVGTLSVEFHADHGNTQQLTGRATNFANDLLDALSYPGFNGMNGIDRAYAYTVWSYGENMTKSQILDDAYSFFEEWPNREMRFEADNIHVDCESLCYVSASYGFDLSNPAWGQYEAGRGWLELTLKPVAGSFVIIEEGGYVIEYY